MKNPELLDIYSDYLLSSFRHTTATGLSAILENSYSHDQISRFLGQSEFDQKDYWLKIKKIVREVETEEGVLAIDDTIAEKPHSSENTLITWHFDHSKGRAVKGINILNFLYINNLENSQSVSLPVSFELITKTETYIDPNTKQEKQRSKVSKNELLQQRLRILTIHNCLKYKYVTWDIWFSAKENFDLVHKELKKYFVAGLKSNRTIALSEEDKLNGKFRSIDSLNLKADQEQKVWLKGLDYELILLKKVFKNEDGSIGEAYLVSNDINLNAETMYEIYQKRWKVEVFHKSLKQNASLNKSPTKYEITQSNHIFAAMIAFCKLEWLKCSNKINHFAIKAKLYLAAIKASFAEVQAFKLNL